MGADTMFDPIDAPEVPQPDAEEWRPVLSLNGAKPDDFHHPKLGEPSEAWRYRNAAGLLEGYVCRFETALPDGTPSKESGPCVTARCLETGGLALDGIGKAGGRIGRSTDFANSWRGLMRL